MNTKTLLLLGVFGAAGLTSAVAQTNVYSVNAVGYVNKTIPAGFSMIANPLNAPTNSLQNLFKAGTPESTQIFKFNSQTLQYETRTYSSVDGGWVDNNLTLSDLALAPGEGAFIFALSSFPVTFVGDVPQGNLTNSLPAGFSMKSSIVPQSGGLKTVLGFTPVAGETVFKFVNGAYQTFNYVGPDQWEDNNLNPVSEPVLQVGEAAFFSKLSAGNWVRSFSVNN